MDRRDQEYEQQPEIEPALHQAERTGILAVVVLQVKAKAEKQRARNGAEYEANAGERTRRHA